jgi:CarD family transcriptional regulator
MNVSSPEASDTLMPEGETMSEAAVVETQVEADDGGAATEPVADMSPPIASGTESELEDAEREDKVEKPAKPALPAKPEKFAEGDYVVYPTHGVGKVERIATEEIAGHKLELIHITFEENRMTLRVPVAKARSAGLRKLATRKLFDDALAVLKGRARIKRTMWSRRAQEYEAKINSGDPLAIAEVVRDLHRNSGQPDQSFSERQIYEAAMDRLAAELAALDRTDKTTAATKLNDFLKTL